MTEESTQACLAEMETRMNQMTYMMAEREAFQTNQMVAMMVEENTQARLTKMEIRLDQMTSMLVEIRNHIMVSPVDTQATPFVDLAGSKRKSAECPRDQYSPRSNWGVTNEMTIEPNPSTCSMQMSKSSYQARGVSKMQEPKKKGLAQRQFTPLPRPLSQLLPRLLEGHIVAKEVPRNNPPRFSGFDETKTCDYHMGERGHNTDNCLVLKIKVQNLMDKGMLSFKEPEPNVHQNLLPKHQGVNMIEEDDSEDEYEAQRQYRREVNRRFMEEATANGETIAHLGDNAGSYRFMVKLTPPAWARDPNYVVISDGWGMDELAEPDVEIPRNEPMLDKWMMTDFQDKRKMAPDVLSEEDNEKEDDSDGEATEELPKEAYQKNLDAWFEEESVDVVITKLEDTLALE